MTSPRIEHDELRARLTVHIERMERELEEHLARQERRRRLNRLTFGLLPRR